MRRSPPASRRGLLCCSDQGSARAATRPVGRRGPRTKPHVSRRRDPARRARLCPASSSTSSASTRRARPSPRSRRKRSLRCSRRSTRARSGMLILAGTAGKYRTGNLLWDALEIGRAGHGGILEYALPDDVDVSLFREWDTTVPLLEQAHPGIGTLTDLTRLRRNWEMMKASTDPGHFAAEYGGVWGNRQAAAACSARISSRACTCPCGTARSSEAVRARRCGNRHPRCHRRRVARGGRGATARAPSRRGAGLASERGPRPCTPPSRACSDRPAGESGHAGREAAAGEPAPRVEDRSPTLRRRCGGARADEAGGRGGPHPPLRAGRSHARRC